MSEEEFDQVINTNLKGTFNCLKHVTRIMLKQRSGRIINMSSIVGVIGNAGQVNYSASKAGVIGMTKSMAREVASRGITVNAIAPGFIATDMTDKLSDKQKEAVTDAIPLKRMGQPEDIAGAISRSGGFLGQARELLKSGDEIPPQTEAFVRAFANRDALLLTQTLVPMEKWKRDQLVPVLASWIGILEEALACRAGMGAVSVHARTLSAGRSSQELMAAVQALKKARDYAMGNVSPAAVCGWLQWQLR